MGLRGAEGARAVSGHLSPAPYNLRPPPTHTQTPTHTVFAQCFPCALQRSHTPAPPTLSHTPLPHPHLPADVFHGAGRQADWRPHRGRHRVRAARAPEAEGAGGGEAEGGREGGRVGGWEGGWVGGRGGAGGGARRRPAPPPAPAGPPGGRRAGRLGAWGAGGGGVGVGCCYRQDARAHGVGPFLLCCHFTRGHPPPPPPPRPLPARTHCR